MSALVVDAARPSDGQAVLRGGVQRKISPWQRSPKTRACNGKAAPRAAHLLGVCVLQAQLGQHARVRVKVCPAQVLQQLPPL